MVTNGINFFIEELKKLNGFEVAIKIGHKLYGDQSIQCALQIINDEERLGFSINKQEIFIYKSDIYSFGNDNGSYYFADSIMQIGIRKTKIAV